MQDSENGVTDREEPFESCCKLSNPDVTVAEQG